MAIPVLNDDIGSASANTYVTEMETGSLLYSLQFPFQETSPQLLLTAMRRLEILPWNGVRATTTQTLSWPRKGVAVDGFQVPFNSIPLAIRQAQVAIAVHYSAENPGSPLLATPLSLEEIHIKSFGAADDSNLSYHSPSEIKGYYANLLFDLPPLVAMLLYPYLKYVRQRSGLLISSGSQSFKIGY